MRLSAFYFGGDKMELKVNDIVEQRYKIVKLVNEGGMSYIYLAIDLKLNSRYVAMKLLKKQYISNYELLQHEAMTLSKLNHPYLPTVLDYFSLNTNFEVIVMEYIEGVTLLQICSQLNRWSKLKILAQLASALAYLHERPTPIIHRDIKPSNIMIDQQLNVKIIDFGISAYSFSFLVEDAQNKRASFGTPTYMAPELLKGEEATIKSDIYSFAILMLYMWDKDYHFLHDINSNIEFFVSQHFKHEHVIFKQLLLTMLQSKPQDRTISFLEVEEQLNYLFYERLNNIDDDNSWVKTNNSYNIAVLNLNRQAGATSIAVSLAQHLSQTNRSIAYMEITDEYANAHLSYLRKYEDEYTEHDTNQVIIKNINFFFKKNVKKQALSSTLQQWQTVISGADCEVLVLDLSSLEERFSLLLELQPTHLLIVVSSPDIHLLPENKMISYIKHLRHYNAPIIHIANKQDIYLRPSLLQDFIDIKQYEQIPNINKADHIAELMSGNWLHPKSLLSKAIKKRLRRLNFFYKQ